MKKRAWLVIGRGRDGGCSRDAPGAASGISHHGHPDRKGPVHVSGGLPDALGQDRDHGDGKDVAESLRAAWLAGPRSGTPRCVGRQGHGALRTGRRPDGRYREPTGGRKDPEGDPIVHQRADQDSGQHAYSFRPYRRQRLLRPAGRGDLLAGESAKRDAASAAARQRPAGPGARAWPAFQWRPITTTPPRRASRRSPST